MRSHLAQGISGSNKPAVCCVYHSMGTKLDDTHCSYIINYDLGKGNANITPTGRNRIPAVVEYTSIEHPVENKAKSVDSGRCLINQSSMHLSVGGWTLAAACNRMSTAVNYIDNETVFGRNTFWYVFIAFQIVVALITLMRVGPLLQVAPGTNRNSKFSGVVNCHNRNLRALMFRGKGGNSAVNL